ncbi:hypothetical protein NEOLEDRAFT_1132194 [Neolentinus lepideus HHB14362 ss-1]|uniref:Uncharacterized protein n=1 Tax=Neolentinus lepideus HHB14362 ss-1 TaxID=1314782 RepID=A0A165TGL9_9AGAM|nr:hypothetical protein NEOLEDRAFT_1132194 [Neolentinus lepideus HHB14362 ss-1]
MSRLFLVASQRLLTISSIFLWTTILSALIDTGLQPRFSFVSNILNFSYSIRHMGKSSSILDTGASHPSPPSREQDTANSTSGFISGVGTEHLIMSNTSSSGEQTPFAAECI